MAACVPENPESAAAIKNHWSEFFAQFPSGKRVLDIATGNGVLLVWGARAARAAGRELQLSGIDLAEIDPARFLPEHRADLEAVRFFGNTAAESLPFADGSVDVVVSQYGLEYADLEPALRETARVLASGGQLHWLAHGVDSAVVAQGRAQLLDMDLLLAPKGPFAAMQTYIRSRAGNRNVDRATRQLTEALHSAEAHCAAHPPATLVRRLCRTILDTVNRFEKYHPADTERWLAENLNRLRGQRQRTRDKLSACLTEDRFARVERVLSSRLWTDAANSSFIVGATGNSVGQLVHAVRR